MCCTIGKATLVHTTEPPAPPGACPEPEGLGKAGAGLTREAHRPGSVRAMRIATLGAEPPALSSSFYPENTW